MQNFAIAFLRNANPSLHSHALKVEGPPASFLLFSTLATRESRYEAASPEDGEVGASKHRIVSEKTEKKRPRLKADKINCVEKDCRGAEESLHVEIFTETAKPRATGRPKASEKAKKKEENVSHAEADAMACVHKEFSEFAKKLELTTYAFGSRWERNACKLLDYGIPLAHVIKMLGKCRNLRCTRDSSTLQNFAMLGMSREEMGHALSGWPTILNITNTMFQSKVEYFESVGIDRYTLGKIICHSPLAIVNPLDVLKKHFAFWDDYLRDEGVNAASVISKNPYLLALNVEKTLKPKIVYLEEIGFQKRMVWKHCSLLTMSMKTLDTKVKLLEQFGISDARKRAHILAVIFSVSIGILQARFSNLLASGFSFDQMRTIIFRCPQALTLTQDHINLKLTYAFNVMKLSHDVLVACPPYWTHSFDKRLKCRYEVIQELRAQGALQKDLTPGYWICMPDEKFTRLFTNKGTIVSKMGDAPNT